MESPDLDCRSENTENSMINSINESTCMERDTCPMSRKKAIDDLVESLRLGRNAVCEILRLLKDKGGDYPLYTKERQRITDIDDTFYCTYRNTANLHTLLEYMQDIAEKLY